MPPRGKAAKSFRTPRQYTPESRPNTSREEREVRVDGEHASLSKGRLTGHQFEPLFEASIAELEAVGLGKTPRELYLSYLQKMPPHL